MKKIEKIINPVIIYYYNDFSSNRESRTFLSFLDYFLLVLPVLLCPCQVTKFPTTDPTTISLFSLAYLSDSGPDLFLSCLRGFGHCSHSFLRLLIIPLFLIIVD